MASKDNKTRLDRTQIVQAALAMADTAGLESLTMRSLGRSLGVEAMSLYNHVANKEDLLDAMVDAVFSEMAVPEPTDPWRAALTERSHSTRTVLRKHSWATPLLDSRTSPGPATLRHQDSTIGCLRNSGFSIGATAHAMALVDAYVYGFAIQEAALPFEGPEETADVTEAIVQQMSPETYPHLVEMATDHVLLPGYDFAHEFDFGLELILDGLSAIGPDRDTSSVG